MKIQSYRFLQFLSNFFTLFCADLFCIGDDFSIFIYAHHLLQTPSGYIPLSRRAVAARPVLLTVAGFEKPLPLYYVEVDGKKEEYALAKSNIKVGTYAPADDLTATVERFVDEVTPTGGARTSKK